MTIYFVQPESSPLVKIGFSIGDTKKRVAHLQCGNHEFLRLLATMRGSLATERDLHIKFRKFHRHGEWFVLSPEIAKFIEDNATAHPQESIESLMFDQWKPKKLGAPPKFTQAKKREARDMLKKRERRTLSKKGRNGKPITVWRAVFSKIEVAATVGVSTGTLHNWIRGGMK